MANILYYPHIDIGRQHRFWLKSAALYWEIISTIVPKSMQDSPYRHHETRLLYQEKILQPVFSEKAKLKASQDFAQYVEKYLSENDQSFLEKISGFRKDSWIYLEKIDPGIRELIRVISSKIRHERSPKIYLPDFLQNYYMTALANYIAKYNNLELFGSKKIYDDLLIKQQTGELENHNYAERAKEGIIASLSLKNIEIDPRTPIEDILRFREETHNERRQFRAAIRDLMGKIDREYETVEALTSALNRVYNENLTPAINALRDESKRRNIQMLAGGLGIFAMAFVPTLLDTNPLLSVALGSAATYATQRLTHYRSPTQADQRLRYVLTAQREFGR